MLSHVSLDLLYVGFATSYADVLPRATQLEARLQVSHDICDNTLVLQTQTFSKGM